MFLDVIAVLPQKFSSPELDSLVKEGLAWFRTQRESFFPSSSPLDDAQKSSLSPFFLSDVLDRARIVDGSRTGDKIPFPPFYERVRAGGARVLPDATHMTAVAFLDVIVFNRQPTLRLVFHNLVHVTQFGILGEERVVRGYFHTINESGLWMVVPFEEQAYQLDARFTRDASDVFSVEEEVRKWAAEGRF